MDSDSGEEFNDKCNNLLERINEDYDNLLRRLHELRLEAESISKRVDDVGIRLEILSNSN